MEKFLSELKDFSKDLFKIIGTIVLVVIIGGDLSRDGGGYIGFVVTYIVSVALDWYADSKEIANTPLASLTIAKIFLFVFYLVVAFLLWIISKGIWEEVSEYLSERSQKRYEIERERERIRAEEEARYSGESQQRCAECVAAMEASESIPDLESLLEEAVANWPRWKKSLSKVFKARKNWTKKNIPESDE